MPTTSKKKPNSKSFFKQEKFTAELSSGQLVVGISILILFGLTCFLLGVLLGRSEDTSRPEYANTAQTRDLEAVRVPDEPSVKQTSTLGNTPPTVHRLPAPQPPAPSPVPEAEAIITSTSEHDSPNPTIEDRATPNEVATPVTTSVPQKPIAPEVTATTTPEPLVASTDIADAPYSVQVGAFGKRANAEAAKKKIESNTAYPVRLINAPESKVTVVLAGAFQDRSAAEKARVVLREKLGYTDSYIKKNEQ